MLLTIYFKNNRLFLSRAYRLIVWPRKFDALRTNISPRGEAPRAYTAYSFKNINFLVENYQTLDKNTIVFVIQLQH